MKQSDNPMYGCVFANASQCAATSKRTGRRCRAPAVTGWKVCRFHGAGGGQKAGSENARFKHGFYSMREIEYRKSIRRLLTCARQQLSKYDDVKQ